ncbi:hypothetical protein [Bradyrhizobium valentinum]|uniref:hypothetical protein n=1 Tax=Bradyrhizobium valentinum TaxID=1518501 RepID=UPI00070C7D2C|nr:hypothetical protein [Bradyrhizobium valentinum]KRQ97107.1 hypothetical protein CQ10_29345 [Bradyrhizobium valentinum]
MKSVTAIGWKPSYDEWSDRQTQWSALFVFTFSVDVEGPGLFNGITYHALSLPESVSPLNVYLLMVCLRALGTLVFIVLASSLASAWHYILFTACVFLSIAYTFNTMITEKHLLPLMIFLFLLVLPRIGRPVATRYAGAMAMLGVCYFVYWIFFKFGSA